MGYYDDISEGYEELHKEEQEKKIKIIMQHLKVNPDDKLLDVGCGSGLTTRCWECKRFGIDPSQNLLEKARKADHEGDYRLAAAEKIPFGDNYFDIVVSITAIQNFNDIKKGLEEIRRVGKGKFVLSFLKKSGNAKIIKNLVCSLFQPAYKTVEEEKDIIFFIW